MTFSRSRVNSASKPDLSLENVFIIAGFGAPDSQPGRIICLGLRMNDRPKTVYKAVVTSTRDIRSNSRYWCCGAVLVRWSGSVFLKRVWTSSKDVICSNRRQTSWERKHDLATFMYPVYEYRTTIIVSYTR